MQDPWPPRSAPVDKSPSASLAEPSSLSEPSPAARWSPLTPRAFIIGLLLIPVLIFWLEYTESVALGPDLAGMSLPMAVVFALLVLVAVNLIVKQIAPQRALSQAELLFIYAMTSVAFWIGGLGMMQFLHPALVGYRYFATSANHWESWWHFLPSWAVPDPSVVADYYAGRSSLLTHLGGWTQAIAVWTAFIFVLLLCMYCINTLMRRQWVEREKLIFPIVIIPLEITKNGGDAPLWRNRLFWAGAAAAALLETLATIHYTLLPTFPYLPIKPNEPNFDLGQWALNSPWNAIGYTHIAFYPLVVGLTFLLSLDVSFSCWFFYLFSKLENVAATAFGFRDPGAGGALNRIPYTNEQALGAFIGIALFSLYFARPHLAATWRKAFRNDPLVDDSDEPMAYRTAYGGLFACSLLLVGFGVALGLSWGLSLLFWALFLLLALTFTRIRAEAGLPWGHEPPGAVHTNLVNMGGTLSFREQDMAAFSLLRWVDADWRCLPQPGELEAMKLAASAEPRPMNPRHLTFAVLVAIVVGTLAAWFSCLGLYYHYGAASAHLEPWRTAQGHYAFDELQGWMNNPKPPDPARIGGGIAGLALVSVLALLRARFSWWPLHPIGYAVGNTDTMTWIWFPVLLGWLVKMLVLRYGGIKAYRQALPLFLGLVLGDYVVSCLWALFFLFTGHPGYRTFPI